MFALPGFFFGRIFLSAFDCLLYDVMASPASGERSLYFRVPVLHPGSWHHYSSKFPEHFPVSSASGSGTPRYTYEFTQCCLTAIGLLVNIYLLMK